MSPEALKAFLIFKNKLIRAWIMNTEDGCLDKDRKATKFAHDEANVAEREFRNLLEQSLVVSQKID